VFEFYNECLSWPDLREKRGHDWRAARQKAG